MHTQRDHVGATVAQPPRLRAAIVGECTGQTPVSPIHLWCARLRPACGVSRARIANVSLDRIGAHKLNDDRPLAAFLKRGEGFPSLARAVQGARLAFTPLRCMRATGRQKNLSD